MSDGENQSGGGEYIEPEVASSDELINRAIAGLPEVAVCITCNEEYPLSEHYFRRDSSKATGFRATCRMCEQQSASPPADAALERRLAAIEATAARVLDDVVERGADVPHLADLYQTIMDAFDGVGGFAKHYIANYLMAKPGSMIRQRMLNTVIKMGTEVTLRGMAQTPVESLSDEDLERELEQRAARLLRYSASADEQPASDNAEKSTDGN